MIQKNLKGTWNQAIISLIIPILLVLTIRWALAEPFVIPSGSMIPNLLVHDHILVNKLSYGLKLPFTNHFLVRWSAPRRGDIVVFRYPPKPEIFYIKRLIGLSGDTLSINDGRISVNGKAFELENSQSPLGIDGYLYYVENNGEKTYQIRFISLADADEKTFEVPSGQYFFMGDNRDESSDSREWGLVDENFLVGKASLIWLSCESMLPTMKFVCDPSQIRWSRLFKSLE